jgi:endonuclease G, mitochondrial
MFREKLLYFLLILSVMINCTSKSAQNQLRREILKPIKKNNKRKENTDALEKTSRLFLYPNSTTGQIIKHKYYNASYSEDDEQSEWVAYKISRNNYNKNIARTNDFRADKSVKTKSASLTDYRGSGYDRGHLAPARAMSYNHASMSESFYLSNMSPQKPSFNRGIWKTLEGKVEYWSNFRDSIYVVSGPILDNPIGSIGENKITVPRAFYKTLISFKNMKMQGIAFIIPNEKSKKSIYSYATSIDEVEKITGIDFYHKMDSIMQERIESNESIKMFIANE